MKLYLFVFFIVIVIFSNCKKEEETFYYFTFNIGAKEYIVDSSKVNIFIQNNGTSRFEIIGSEKSGRFSLNAFGYNPFDTSVLGTYLTTMTPERKKILLGGGFTSRESNDNNVGTYPVTYDGQFSLTIGEKTPTFISGTFSGILKEQLDPSRTVNITNGRFKLPY